VRDKVFSIDGGNPNEIIPNLKCTPLPTEQQWAELYQLANQALAAGTITLDQVAFIKMIDNYKQAYAYLALQQKKGQMQQMQSAQQQSQMNAEVQAQAAAQAQAGKENLEKIKVQGEIVKEVAKAMIENPKSVKNLNDIMHLMMIFATDEQKQAIQQQMQMSQQAQMGQMGATPEDEMMLQEQMAAQQEQAQQMSPEEQQMMAEQMAAQQQQQTM
jgi:hypothetical protein